MPSSAPRPGVDYPRLGVNNTWMPRGRRLLAERLGVGARTECGYFRAKDTLLDVSIDATGAGLAIRRSRPAGDWTAGVRQLMLALLDQLDEPLLVGLRLRRTIISPDVTRWTEAGLEILQQAGLSPGQVFRPLFLYTFGHAAFAPREDIAGRCPKGRAQPCSASRQTHIRSSRRGARAR